MITIPAAYATEGQGVTPFAAAVEAKCMHEAGMDVRLEKLGSATVVAKALSAGRVLFGNMAAPAVVHAVVSGSRVAFLTSGINQQFLAVRAGLASLAELEGGIFAASSPGDLSEFMSRFVIEKELDQGSVEYLGGSEARLRALIDGSVDASPLSPPTALLALDNGCGWVLDYADYGLNFAIGGIAASRDFATANGALVEACLGADLRGQALYKADREFGIWRHQRYGEVDRLVAERTYDITHAGFRDEPMPDTDGLRRLIAFLKARGDTPPGFTIDRVIMPEPIEEVLKKS